MKDWLVITNQIKNTHEVQKLNFQKNINLRKTSILLLTQPYDITLSERVKYYLYSYSSKITKHFFIHKIVWYSGKILSVLIQNTENTTFLTICLHASAVSAWKMWEKLNCQYFEFKTLEIWFQYLFIKFLIYDSSCAILGIPGFTRWAEIASSHHNRLRQ